MAREVLSVFYAGATPVTQGASFFMLDCLNNEKAFSCLGVFYQSIGIGQIRLDVPFQLGHGIQE